jgi:hypothetical protein
MNHPSTSPSRLPRFARRLPLTSARPVFGVLVLLVLAVALIWHGEPQPSSRPSGTSVGVSGTASADGTLAALLVIRGDRVQQVHAGSIRTVPLPAAAQPRSITSGRGLSVVLALVDGRQRAFAVTAKLIVTDLGYADGVVPAVQGQSAVIVEAAVVSPGSVVATPSPSASRSPRSTGKPTEPDLRDFLIRRFDAAARPVGVPVRLPIGFRVGVDTTVGLTVWQPVNRVFQDGVEQESLSARALLIRPDSTQRQLGTVHPLAADASNLLVWDVADHRFGVMPLQYVTSSATSTVTPSHTPSVIASGSAPTPSPSIVAGTRWFLPTRGMVLVTGPAAFSPDGSAFAVYAAVGSRRRLVVAQLKNLGSDQVEVLVLAQPPVKSSPGPTGSSSVVLPSGGSAGSSQPGSTNGSASGSTAAKESKSASPSATSSALSVAPDGYPIPAPLTPLWSGGMVVAVALDSTVIGYRPGSVQSSELDLGLAGVAALAPAP